jgi:hypothetical protein
LIGDPKLIEVWARIEKVPSILMLIMAISGSYLYLLPYIAKSLRKRRAEVNN